MKIAKLEPSRHKEGRWLVWLEDGTPVRVGEGDVIALGLYAGKELDEESGAALTAAAQYSKLNERAVEMLSARVMSKKELTDKLSALPRRRKGKDEREEIPDADALQRQKEELHSQAEAVAGRMEELGLLNDGEYAAAIVRNYAAKGYGPRKLRDELYRRGIPKEFWKSAMARAGETGDAIDKLVEKKLRGLEPTRENLKRTADYLARRGYGWEEISAALSRYDMGEE